jgi:hypothetical protein
MERIQTREQEVRTQLDERRQTLGQREAELTQATTDVARAQSDEGRAMNDLRRRQDAVTRRIQNITGEAVINHWMEASRENDSARPEVLREGTEQAAQQARDNLEALLYRNGSVDKYRIRECLEIMKNSKPGESNIELGRRVVQSMLGGGSGLYGMPNASAEMRPHLEQLLRPENEQQLRDLAGQLNGDVLKLAAYKTPNLLKRAFKKDELAMRALRDDILPQQMMQMREDNPLRRAIEQASGGKLNKRTAAEFLRDFMGNKWTKATLVSLLGVLAGAGIFYGAIPFVAGAGGLPTLAQTAGGYTGTRLADLGSAIWNGTPPPPGP